VATLATFDRAGKAVRSATLAPAGAQVLSTFLTADRYGNLATFADYYTDPTQPGAGRFRLANAGGPEIGVATITKPQIVPGPFPYENANGVVATGIGAFNVVWHLFGSGQVYIQSFVVPRDDGPATSFYTVPPCRLVDTRATGSPLGSGQDRVFEAAGHCEIPSTARTLAVNAVAVGSTAAGQLRFYRPDRPASPIAPLSYSAGRTRGVFALLGLDDDARFAVRAAQLSGSVDVVIDVTGYFE
jgi:hypothetical protein